MYCACMLTCRVKARSGVRVLYLGCNNHKAILFIATIIKVGSIEGPVRVSSSVLLFVPEKYKKHK